MPFHVLLGAAFLLSLAHGATVEALDKEAKDAEEAKKVEAAKAVVAAANAKEFATKAAENLAMALEAGEILDEMVTAADAAEAAKFYDNEEASKAANAKVAAAKAKAMAAAAAAKAVATAAKAAADNAA